MHVRERNHSAAPYLAAVAAVGACSLYFGFVFPQTPAPGMRSTAELTTEFSLWSSVRQIALPVPQDSTTILLAMIGVSAIAFAAYSGALMLSWRQRGATPGIAWSLGPCIGLFACAVVFLPNFDSDIYNYILRGRIAAVYGESPYRVVADTYPDDPVYKYAEPRYTRRLDAAKLPSWKLVNIALASLGGDRPVVNLLLYRSVFFIVNVANAVLIWQILKRTQPDLAFFGVVFYGWNPLVAIFGQSKTDTFMVFYLLTGVLLLVLQRQRLAAVFLALSVWVKLITLPLLGVKWLGELKTRSWKSLLTGAAAFALVTLAVYLPFGDVPGLIWMHLTQMDKAGSTSPGAVRTAITAGFALLTVALGFVQNGSLDRLLKSWALVLLYFALFLTKLNLGWYMMVPIAIVALTAEWRLAAVTTACSFCCMVLTFRDGSFSRDFPGPELFDIPRPVVYLMLPVATVVAIGAYTVWSRRRAIVERSATR